MKKPICSCLIPTRGRVGKLFTAIHTINNSCSDPSNVEILIRADEDDDQTVRQYINSIRQFSNVKVFVGPRKLGYPSLGEFYTELAKAASGAWCWFLLDDCLIGGRDFDLKFAEIPTTGFIVQPEITRIGGSIYPKWEGGNFPAAPTRSWESMGWPMLLNPLDTAMDQFYRQQNGWKTWFLPGITGWHLMHQEYGH